MEDLHPPPQDAAPCRQRSWLRFSGAVWGWLLMGKRAKLSFLETRGFGLLPPFPVGIPGALKISSLQSVSYTAPSSSYPQGKEPGW